MLRAQLTSTAALAGWLRFNSIEDYLMYFKLVAAGLLIVLASASSVQAQMSLDVSKITCDQFVHHKVGSPRMIAAWLSGYYNAKRNNLTIDLQNDFNHSYFNYHSREITGRAFNRDFHDPIRLSLATPNARAIHVVKFKLSDH